MNRISNSEELIKFLNQINDLDLRETRKKEYLESLRLESDDSDIFGSEISQVEVHEEMGADSVQEEVVSDREVTEDDKSS